MPKQTLKVLDLTTLLVALDHVEEYGPAAVCPDPNTNPTECVYLTYIGSAQLAALTARLPHVEVLFKTPGGAGRNKILRNVFSKPTILHVLRFAFSDERAFIPFVRDLESIDRKYWRVQPGEQEAGNQSGQPPVAVPPLD